MAGQNDGDEIICLALGQKFHLGLRTILTIAVQSGRAATKVLGKAVSPLRSATALQNRREMKRFRQMLMPRGRAATEEPNRE